MFQKRVRFRVVAPWSTLEILTIALFFTGCDANKLTSTAQGFSVEPSAIALEPGWVGFAQPFELAVTNSSRFTGEFTISAADPLAGAQVVTIGPGETRGLSLSLTNASAGTVSSELSVAFNGDTVVVPVTGEAREVPACAASGDCQETTFDPTLGTCVIRELSNGSACGSTNHCISHGTCENGTCVGAPVDCDDHDVCTADSCALETGCAHQAIEVLPPSADSCHIAFCDPVRGRVVTEAADGTSCGPHDCNQSSICLAGTCVKRPTPDGTRCGEASPCQDVGVCSNHVCDRPAPRMLTPDWSIDHDTTRPSTQMDMRYDGHTDTDGNIYALLNNRLMSWTRDGALRWEYPPTGGYDKTCTVGTCTVPTLLLDQKNALLYALDARESAVVALSLATGALQWTTRLAPLVQTREQPQTLLASQLTLSRDSLVVNLTEGRANHWTHLLWLDRRTGALRFHGERAGHPLKLAAQSDGTVILSMAECTRNNGYHTYANRGEVARFDWSGNALPSVTLVGNLSTFTRNAIASWSGVRLDIYNTQQQTRANFPFPTGLYFDGMGESWSNDHRTVLFANWYEDADVSSNLWCEAEYCGGHQMVLSVTNFAGPIPTLESTSEPLWNSNAGALLADDSLLLLEHSWYTQLAVDVDLPVSPSMLSLVGRDGKRLWRCPLQPVSTGAMGITTGRVFINRYDGLDSYRIPGIVPETRGWSTNGGNQARDRVAR